MIPQKVTVSKKHNKEGKAAFFSNESFNWNCWQDDPEQALNGCFCFGLRKVDVIGEDKLNFSWFLGELREKIGWNWICKCHL